MIHDIDLILSIIQSNIVDIKATGSMYVTESLDLANAKLVFANGGVANITVSRVATQPIRKMCIFQPESYINVNFQEKAAEKIEFQDSTPIITKIQVFEYNAIVEELSDFIFTINQRKPPTVTMKDGLNALRIADKVVNDILQQNYI
jgi:predicted dehydrogenase